MKYPKISIVTPSLNQGKYIERCIQSVLIQYYPNFEHIIVDSGSQDETLRILRKYSHLKWISEPDDGQAQAINKGFATSQGELLAWLNCDDEYRPGAFFSVADAAVETQHQAVIMGEVELYYEDAFLRVMKNYKRNFFRFLQPWIPYTNISQSGVFIPRNVLNIIGELNKDLYFVMDYDLICRMLRNKIRFYSINQIIARYNIHRSCKTGQGWHYMYPELDRVSLRHASELLRFQKLIFQLSFRFLRPSMRMIYRMVLPSIF